MRHAAVLADVAAVFNGKTPSVAEQRDQGHPVLKIKDVDDVGLFRGAFESFVEQSLAESFRHKWIESGDTLILNAAHNADYVGSKTYFAAETVSGALPTGEWLVVRGFPGIASKRYIHHWLTSAKTRSHIRDCVKGIHLYPKDVAELPISLPPFEQQERIATLLDKADAIRRKRREALNLADEFLRSAFLDLFGDPVVNPKRWQRTPLGKLTTKIGSGATPLGGETVYKQDGISFIRSMNVYDGAFLYDDMAFIDETQAARLANVEVASRDLLLNITGASVARTCLVPDDVLPARVNQHVMIIRCGEKLVPEFLEAHMICSSVKAQLLRIGEGMGATRQAITKAQLEDFQVITPPREEQGRFGQLVSCIRKQGKKQEQMQAESETLFASLQQRVFRGDPPRGDRDGRPPEIRP